MSEFYTFSANSLSGEAISMERYQDQVVLVVNTASKCGFTPQYAGLQELYDKYQDQGFVVLGFPCNQFASQEPGNGEQISEFCSVNYGVTFPMFEKIDVNGENAHPLFQYLCKALPGLLGNRVKWNFTKFLLDRDGLPVKRFASATKPSKLEPDIKKLL